jgi:hypothetical protein
MFVVELFTSVTSAVPRAPLYAPVPPVTATGSLRDRSATNPWALSVPFESCTWTLHRVCLPMTVQTPRSMPVSPPEILSPKPKRSPWCGLCFGKKPTFFSLF